MTTSFGRAALGAAVVAFTCLSTSAHADTAPAAEPTTAAPAPAAPPAAAPATSPATSTTTEPPAAESHRTAWPWVLMGGGVALIVTAGVLEIHAVKEDDRREAAETKLFALPPGDPDRAQLQQSATSHDDSAKSTRTAALVIGTVGFLAVAGSVVLWFVEGGSSSPSPKASGALPATRPKPSLTPSFGPGYAGASFGATF